MTDDLVKRLRDSKLTWGGRLEAADRIEQLERDKREAALDALAAMGQAQEAYEAQLKAEDKVEQLERWLDEHRRNWERAFNANTVLEERIKELEQEAILDAKLLADTQALLDTALEAVIDAKLVAEAKVQALEAERDAALAALEESGRKRGETLALLDKAVVALQNIAHGGGYTDMQIARAVLAEIEGGKKDD